MNGSREMIYLVGVIVVCVLFVGCGGEARQLEQNDRVMFFGDSITFAGAKENGYVRLTAEAIGKAYPGKNIKIASAGVSGDKISDLQERLDRDVLQKTPTIVVIYCGINDIWHWVKPDPLTGAKRKGTTKEDFEAGLRDIVKQIKDINAKVILCTLSVIGEKTDGTNMSDERLDDYSDVARRIAADTDCELIDLRREFIGYLEKYNEQNVGSGILTEDGVHPNARGHRFLAGIMIEALNVPLDK